MMPCQTLFSAINMRRLASGSTDAAC
jgi:hypothetical protein